MAAARPGGKRRASLTTVARHHLGREAVLPHVTMLPEIRAPHTFCSRLGAKKAGRGEGHGFAATGLLRERHGASVWPCDPSAEQHRPCRRSASRQEKGRSAELPRQRAWPRNIGEHSELLLHGADIAQQQERIESGVDFLQTGNARTVGNRGNQLRRKLKARS